MNLAPEEFRRQREAIARLAASIPDRVDANAGVGRKRTCTYDRTKYLPKSVENVRRKMRELEAEAEALCADDVLRCLRAANEAWERETKLAALQGKVRAHLQSEQAELRECGE